MENRVLEFRTMLRVVGTTGLMLLLFLSLVAAHTDRENREEERSQQELSLSDPTDSTEQGTLQTDDLLASCAPCHSRKHPDYIGDDPDHLFNQRIRMSREEWKTELNLSAKCGMCHTLVEPGSIEQRRWKGVLFHMQQVIKQKEWPVTYTEEEWLDILHYYVSGSKNFDDLPPDPPLSSLHFSTQQIGLPPHPRILPMIGNVNVVDLDQNGEPDVLATDFKLKGVAWIHRTDTGWVEKVIARTPVPAKTEVFDANHDGHLDVVVASIGSAMPTDDLVGSIQLLINDGECNFTQQTLLEDMGRLSDVRPADFDNDGDYDFVVAVFGFLNVGEIGWIENEGEGEYEYHRLIKKAGGIHVIPTYLNDDEYIDFVALLSQEHEEIIGFINDGDDGFEQHLIYKAFTPAYGSSGIELVDMDDDGDLDILYTNGDAIDLPAPMPLPYHGIQWLENKGDLEYESHSIFSFYGAYRALPGDLDGDGDLDILAVSLFNKWDEEERLSAIWLENDGELNFTPHGIGNDVTALISVDLGDMDMDGDLDFVTAGMHVYPDPFGRIGRVTLWTNEGKEEGGQN